MHQQEYSQEDSQEHSQQYSQEGLAMASLYLNAICMGFMRLAEYDVAICMGFKGVPFKTHANTSNSATQSLKTHAFYIINQAPSPKQLIKSC